MSAEAQPEAVSREEQPRLRKCASCGTYTLQSTCPDCKGQAVPPGPAKFSPDDKYAKYRRAYKEGKV